MKGLDVLIRQKKIKNELLSFREPLRALFTYKNKSSRKDKAVS